ncbi:MAG TPA: S8 family serine peptidase [Thermoanaerobaculia bacterium]
MKKWTPFFCGLAIILLSSTGAAAGEMDRSQNPPSSRELSVALETKPSKLTSEFQELARLDRWRGRAAAQSFAAERGLSFSGATVKVVIQFVPGSVVAVKSHLHTLGATVETVATDLILARVPVSALQALASADEVKIVRRPHAPTPFGATSEGVNAMGAIAWHAAGRKGAGVKVAILDLGFSGYQSLMGSEIPNIPPTRIKSFSGDIGGGTEHGLAVAEIVHDVAPEAELYLANFSNDVELELAVQWLIDQRVHVINASWGYPCGGPLDGTGPTNALVRRAAEAGILWISAAGNFAQRHWSAAFNDSNADGWHNFASNEEGNTVFLNSGDELRVCVAWDDWTKRDQDFDLYVWNSNGAIVGSSTNSQGGPDTHDPSELVTFTASATGNYHIGVKRDRGTRNPVLHLYAYPPGTECAIEAVAAAHDPMPSDFLGELRQFRDHVLAPSRFGRVLIESYYRHSAELRRTLLSHPLLAIEAVALMRASRPAVQSVLLSRRGVSSDGGFVISEAYASRVDRFLDRVSEVASPTLGADLAEFRAKAALSAAAGQSVQQYWESLLRQPPILNGAADATYPDPGYLRYATLSTSVVPPADSAYSLTVGAINWATGVLEEFSSRGPTADGRVKPEIAATDGVCTATYGNCGMGGFAGTSAAAPHVAGAAALVQQVYPLRTPAEIRNFLTGRAVDVSPAGADNQTGAGRLALGAMTDVDVLPAPSLLGPLGTNAPIWPTFHWSEIDGAASYRLMVATSATALPTDPLTQACSGCLVNTTVSTSYFTPAVPLLAASTYYFQVQGRTAVKNGLWARATFVTSVSPELTRPERTNLIEESGPWPAAAGKAVLITHGWRASAAPKVSGEQTWVKEMAEKMCGRLSADRVVTSVGAGALTKMCQAQGWDVWVMDWSARADTGLPWSAVANATAMGEAVATNLITKNYTHLHLIAHSAGSNLIDSATRRLKLWTAQENRPGINIHETFLDAYEPARDAGRYGVAADWADNYVDTRDLVKYHLGLDGTQLFLTNAYNIDVTPPGPDSPNVNALARHGRPYRFYGLSVASSFVGDGAHAAADPIGGGGGVGYPLSVEMSRSLSSLGATYKRGEGCLVTGSSCIPQVNPARRERLGPVKALQTVVSAARAVTWIAKPGSSFLFDLIKIGFVSMLSEAPNVSTAVASAVPTEAPAHIVIDVVTTQPVDKLRFNRRFGATGEGFLRVFVGGMLVRETDQRHVAVGLAEVEEIYIGGAAGTLPPGTHRIVFRLDGFGTRASGVEITGVELGLTSESTARRRAVGH